MFVCLNRHLVIQLEDVCLFEQALSNSIRGCLFVYGMSNSPAIVSAHVRGLRDLKYVCMSRIHPAVLFIQHVPNF